jgi:hypothetical protein
MHRSGTSLIARLFYEAGANMGDPNTFYRPDIWNPDGYFEQPDIHAINMPLINGPFWKLSYFWLPSTRTIMKRARRRADQIRETTAQYEGAVIKETRFCLTLPAWLEYGANVERILVCLREPNQVARSIQKRNHTLIRHGYYLWHEHNKRLLENVGDIPIWYVNYHHTLDPDKQIPELTRAFQFMGYNLPQDKIRDLASAYVKPSMNHNNDTAYKYPSKIQALWDDLLERHAVQVNSMEA